MAKKEQTGLPGIPQAPERPTIEEIEDISLEIDKVSGKRTALSDKIHELKQQRQAMLVKHKLTVYTYENADGILKDVVLEPTTKTVKSKLNPKKKKGGDE